MKKGFLRNNDFNITASCFDVDFTTDTLFAIHTLPSFCEFVFEKPENRAICVVNTFKNDEYGATSYIRLAFTAYQMKQFCFSMGEMDPTRGTCAYSQKEKLDKMNDWMDIPFHMFQCKRGTLTTSLWPNMTRYCVLTVHSTG